jgi:hypothetical protein
MPPRSPAASAASAAAKGTGATTTKLPDVIDGYSLSHLLKTAKDVVKRKTQQSVVLDREAEDRIPKFHELGAYMLRVVDLLRGWKACQR